ncbi:MAG: hypothetical protein JXR37_21300 [Kiritimatiellae bacterium]|nr:hypothetical protein [Kiritimatiellia bacterium]
MNSEPWIKPDLSLTWVISDVRDGSAFMRFVFSLAPDDSLWGTHGVWSQDLFRSMKQLAPDGAEGRLGFLAKVVGLRRAFVMIPLSPGNKATIIDLTKTYDFAKEILEQHVAHSRKCLLVSPDNLTCCWLSRDIPVKTLKEASRSIGFAFEASDSKD